MSTALPLRQRGLDRSPRTVSLHNKGCRLGRAGSRLAAAHHCPEARAQKRPELLPFGKYRYLFPNTKQEIRAAVIPTKTPNLPVTARWRLAWTDVGVLARKPLLFLRANELELVLPLIRVKFKIGGNRSEVRVRRVHLSFEDGRF